MTDYSKFTDSFKHAKEKAKLAEETSNIGSESSSTSDVGTSKKRKRTARIAYSDEEDDVRRKQKRPTAKKFVPVPLPQPPNVKGKLIILPVIIVRHHFQSEFYPWH